jgi:hypothetical protein
MPPHRGSGGGYFTGFGAARMIRRIRVHDRGLGQSPGNRSHRRGTLQGVARGCGHDDQRSHQRSADQCRAGGTPSRARPAEPWAGRVRLFGATGESALTARQAFTHLVKSVETAGVSARRRMTHRRSMGAVVEADAPDDHEHDGGGQAPSCQVGCACTTQRCRQTTDGSRHLVHGHP